MTRRASRPGRAPKPRDQKPAAPPAPRAWPLTHPALLATLVAGALCVLLSASYQLYDTDLWQHLAMGRAIWAHGLPRTNLWTWPQYGQPYFLSSWGFRALLWPLWSAGGVGGLFAWRWLSTLGVFALLLATARGLGARGFSAVVVLVWASLGYRLRTNVRPETVGALLFARELWLLERDRRAGPASSGRALWWIAAIACAWANLHISWYLGFLLLGIYGADALWEARRPSEAGAAARARAKRLAWVAAASAVAALANPFGVQTLVQPFEFALFWRNDPLMRTIGELQPLPWRDALAGDLFAWPLLLVLRARRRGIDLAEALACVVSTALALSSLRFGATYALMAAPFVARDLQDFLVSRRWPVPRLPLGARATLAVAIGVAMCAPGWMRRDLPFGVSIDPQTFPERACDFMEAHAIRGRGLNNSSFGGYMAYRFSPDRERLPFLSTQPEYATTEDRALFLSALRTESGWRALEARHDFDYVLYERDQAPGDSLLDFLDRDPRFALVFSDDAAELLVRRDRFAGVADSFGYRLVPAGQAGRYALGPASQTDTLRRVQVEAELDRMIAASPLSGGASHLRGFLALMDGDLERARRDLERTARIDPLVPNIHDLLGSIALTQGRWRDAIREYDAERRDHEPPPGLFFRTGVAWSRLGDRGRARACYRRELARDPGFAAARDSLEALESSTR
jgi:hypothetical protein